MWFGVGEAGSRILRYTGIVSVVLIDKLGTFGEAGVF